MLPQRCRRYNLAHMDVRARSLLPENAPDKRADDALFIDSAKGVQIRDPSVRSAEEEIEAKWRSALVLQKVSD